MKNTIKKGALTVAALAALGFGGAQLADATSESPKPAGSLAPADTNDPADAPQSSEASEVVGGADAAKAKAAALAKVAGTVTRLSAERPDDVRPGEATDAPEPGDHADPAYEAKIAFDVEVTKADGTIVDVHLDRAFGVLGTEAEGRESGADDQPEAADSEHGDDDRAEPGDEGETEARD